METFILGVMAGLGFGATFAAVLSRAIKTPAPVATVVSFAVSGIPAFVLGLYFSLQS